MYQMNTQPKEQDDCNNKNCDKNFISISFHNKSDVYKRQQFGGDDQWRNMLGGTELIRRKLGKDAYAMTINLLLNSEGKKQLPLQVFPHGA